MNPLVSIVMPTYNGEKYIGEAIDSVLNQSYNNWELIIVNDGSKDGTASVISEYLKIDSRIQSYDNEENSGISITLNNGFRKAKGVYYTWTSDDNICKPHAIRKMVEYLENHHEYGMVYADMDIVDETGSLIRSVSEDVSSLYYNDMIGGCFLYSAQAAKEIGDYDSQWTCVQDYDYWLRFNRLYDIGHLKENLYCFRRHGHAMTSLKENRLNLELYKLRMKHIDVILKHMLPLEKICLFIDMYCQNHNEVEGIKKDFFGDNIPDEVGFLYRQQERDKSKKAIIFGCGEFGEKALELFGEEDIAYFVDNNPQKAGTVFSGKEVLSFEEYVKAEKDYQTIVAVGSRIIPAIIKQIENAGVSGYTTYIQYAKDISNFNEMSEGEK